VCAAVGVAVPSVSTPEDRACWTCGRASCVYLVWRLAVSVPRGCRDSPAAAWPMVHRGPPRSCGTLSAAGRELRGRFANHRGPRPTSLRAPWAAGAKGFSGSRAPALVRSADGANGPRRLYMGKPRLSAASRQVSWPSMNPAHLARRRRHATPAEGNRARQRVYRARRRGQKSKGRNTLSCGFESSAGRLP
jgi:hypothetical protein